MIRSMAGLCCAFFATSSLFADDFNKYAVAPAYIKERDLQRNPKLESAQAWLRKSRNNREERGKAEKEIEFLESERFQPELVDSNAGGVGRLNSASVIQVVNDHELLVDVKIRDSRTSYATNRFTAWISNLGDVSDVTDDHRVNVGVVYVVGTKKYTTVLGAMKTVLHLHAFGPDDWDRVREIDGRNEAATANVERRRKELARKPIRTWTDATGRFTIDARFKSYAAGKLTLETEEGREIEVPLDKLSEEDHEYVKELARM